MTIIHSAGRTQSMHLFMDELNREIEELQKEIEAKQVHLHYLKERKLRYQKKLNDESR